MAIVRLEDDVKDRPETEVPDVKLLKAGPREAVDAEDEGGRADKGGREDGKRVVRTRMQAEDEDDGRKAYRSRRALIIKVRKWNAGRPGRMVGTHRRRAPSGPKGRRSNHLGRTRGSTRRRSSRR